MVHENLKIADFSYNLPEEKIAKYPLAERDNSKLLVYKQGQIDETIYKNLDQFLPPDTLLVFNDTKVVEARLIFQKSTGAVIEVFCLEPAAEYRDVTQAMNQTGSVHWKCLIGGASKWKHGMVLEKTFFVDGKLVLLQASITERLSDCFVVQLSWQPTAFTFAEVLHFSGFMPLPPYLHRDVEENDKVRYQTVYARQEGSVAAPTAGLHFTPQLFEKLEQKGIAKSFVTLHVGAGTFKPVKAESIKDHEMHAEFIDVNIDTIQQLLAYTDKTIVAVGTTSLRTIESLYWMGLKAATNPAATIEELTVHQWDAYQQINFLSNSESLTSLLNWMKKHQLTRLLTKTQIMIAPGYALKVAKGIVTNFHQPQSTLLLLIAAVVGNSWRNIYQYALENEYRFLSFGDGCLLWDSHHV